MEEIKSLADQLRDRMRTPENGELSGEPIPEEHFSILDELRAFDNADHKSMVHVRFDNKTLRTMNQFKMATGIDVTKFVAFSVRQVLSAHPEIKTIIKQFLQELE